MTSLLIITFYFYKNKKEQRKIFLQLYRIFFPVLLCILLLIDLIIIFSENALTLVEAPVLAPSEVAID